VTDESLTKEQDQARLRDAATCLMCKRIWATFSNDFCGAHSVTGWKAGLDNPKSSDTVPPNRTVASRARTKQAIPKKNSVAIPTIASTGSRTWKTYLGWLAGLALLGGCIAQFISDSSAEESISTTVPPKRPKTFPRFIDLTFGEAIAAIEKIDPSISVYYVEAINDYPYDDDMIVVDQAPPVGAPTAGVMTVCLMVVKDGSQSYKRRYTFSEDCPKSQGDVLAEIASAWIPEGFVELGNERTQGFATSGESTLEDCTWEGAQGRCSRSRLASKNGCANGAAIVVKWLNSLNQVVDTSIFSTSGRVERGGTFEYVAFLPYSSWDKPVSSLLYQVRC
jgi:hypothetical protein